MSMDCSRMIDTPPDHEDFQILAKILAYLSAGELRSTRLVSSVLNTLICSHPDLLWAKNRIRLNNARLTKRWRELRSLDLIRRYDCPNFHFYKMERSSPNAIAFFQGPVPSQIKHLKWTLRGFESEALFHVLFRVANNLEHLELVGLCPVVLNGEDFFRPEPWANLHFCSLLTLILRSNSDEAIPDDPVPEQYLKLPISFLDAVLVGAPHLASITFTRWSSSTCHNLCQLMSTLPAHHLEEIRYLEICCVLEKLEEWDVHQYCFIKSLEYSDAGLPSLRKLILRFDDDLWEVPGLSWAVVEDLLKTFPFNKNLQLVQLQCPVSPVIFGEKLSSVHFSFRKDARGTLAIQFDKNGREEQRYMLEARNVAKLYRDDDRSSRSRSSMELAENDTLSLQTYQNQTAIIPSPAILGSNNDSKTFSQFVLLFSPWEGATFVLSIIFILYIVYISVCYIISGVSWLWWRLNYL